MDPVFKEQFIKELESGKWQQYQGALRGVRPYERCALGVAYEVCDAAGIRHLETVMTDEEQLQAIFMNDGWKWVKEDDDHHVSRKVTGPIHTFAEIAKYIKENY